MQFSALRYFLETVRVGSIRRAAEALNVAPSAVSRQIALLEQSYGMPLFERRAAGMRLTSAGELFARQAHRTMRDFERLRSEIDDLQQLRRGAVRVCTTYNISGTVLSRAIEQFAVDYPGITFDVQMVNGIPAIEAVAAEQCDIAIAFEPPFHPDVEEVQALRDPIVAIMRPAHPLASRGKVTLRELTEHPVMLLDETNTTRIVLDRALAAEGLSLQARVTVSHLPVAFALARSHQVITFSPSEAARTDVEAGLLKVVGIDAPMLLATRSVLCRHRSRPMTLAAQAFLLALRRQFTALEGERLQSPGVAQSAT
jgi:DNA-binding transcriptional LysR family regulator